MKLAVFSDEVSQELETALKLAVKYQLDGVELRSVWNTPVQHLTGEQVSRIRHLLEEHGLAVAALASPVFKCELDDEAQRREHLEYLRSCCRLAHQFDTKLIRIFAFWKHGPSAPVWDRIRANFRPALPIAEDAGLTLMLENEATTYCATAAETARFVSEMNSPALKVAWDPCNEVFAEDGLTPYPDAYRLVQAMTIHVHVKDSTKDAAGVAQIAPLGDGVVDWKGQLADLLSRGYSGYVSLETHWRPQALSEDVLNQPGGAGFSEAGEYASDLCLRNLMETLAEARRAAGR